ncbi:hypothetical protein JCM3766R1_004660 [Sporobolomyces carnicolor]
MTSWITILSTTAIGLLVVTGLVVATAARRASSESSPTSSSTDSGRTRYDAPGPVIASTVANLDLDGLTIIPVTHLPRLRWRVAVPFTQSHVACSVEISSSEMSFGRLRVDTASCRARDTFRDPIDVSADGISVEMKGNTGVRVRLEWITTVAEPATTPTTTTTTTTTDEEKKKKRKKREWTWRTSGRTAVKLDDASLKLRLRLTKSRCPTPSSEGEGDKPHVEVISTELKPGMIRSLHLDGFEPWIGRLVTFVVPYIRSTLLVSYPVAVAGDYLIREAVEGRPVDELLGQFAHFATKHVDGELYGAIVDDERDDDLSTPLDATLLVPPPRSSFSNSTRDDDEHAPPPPSRTATATATRSTPFRFHAHLLGPTRLHSFRLPDFAPELYRRDGKGLRNTLQSLNLVTSEFKLLISRSVLESITFSSASVAFDPPREDDDETRRGGVRGGELVVTVSPLACTLASSFSLTAGVKNPIVSWASGFDQVGERGTSRTTVRSESLQIRLRLTKRRHASASTKGAPIVLGVERDALGVNGGRDSAAAKALSMSDFSSIESRVDLESKLGRKLGEKVVNKLLESLKTQLAQAASLIIAHFLVDLARDRLQQVLDEVDEKLRVEGGVEWGKDDDDDDVASPPRPHRPAT